MKELAILVCVLSALGLEQGHSQALDEETLDASLKRLPPIGDEEAFIRQEYMTNEAVLAFQGFGTNALPQLLSRLRSSDDSERTHAKLGITFLGDAAKSAIPELTRLLDDPRFSEDAGLVLARLGSEGIRALTNGLASRNWEVREATAFCLCLDGDDSTHVTKEARRAYRLQAAVAVPNLITLLRDPNPKVGAASAYALGSLRERSDLALPALSTVSTDTNIDAGVRKVAAKSITKLQASSDGAQK